MNIIHHRLEALRDQIRLLENQTLPAASSGVLPFGDPRLNAPLPRGGLQLGALHEICANGPEAEMAATTAAFTAMLAAHILRGREGPLLWVASRTDCYMPGLIRFGLDPFRTLWADCAKDAGVPGVMEEALHSRALAAVVGEAGSLTLKTGRRLDAAARQSGTAALLLRRQRSKPSKADETPSGAAATRWRLSAVPSVALEPGLGPYRWRLDLDYCRNGRTASWIVEACDGANSKEQACHVRVVAELRDDACEAEDASPGKAPRTARSA